MIRGKGVELCGLIRSPDQNHGAIGFQQFQIGIQIMGRRHGVQNEVELFGESGQGFRLCGGVIGLCAQPLRIGLFLVGVAQDRDVGAECRADLDGHVSEAA
jgi:hypothetical protein